MECGRPNDFFEKNQKFTRSLALIIILLILFAIEFVFKLSDNKFFQRISQEEKNLVDLFLNFTIPENV